MLNTEEFLALEDKWKRYKIIYFSRYIIFLLVVCVSLILFFSASTFFSKNNSAKIVSFNNVTENATTILNTTNTTPQVVQSNTNNGSQASLIVFSIDDFNKLLENMSNKNNLDTAEKIVKNERETFKDNSINDDIDSNKAEIEEPVKNKILIETNEEQNIVSLQKRYYNTNNIVFATMLSEEYYEIKDYTNSLKWALEANEKDSQSELSWIMFAKSKYRLGAKDEAINALKVFLKHKKSPSVANLLKQITNDDLFY